MLSRRLVGKQSPQVILCLLHGTSLKAARFSHAAYLTRPQLFEQNRRRGPLPVADARMERVGIHSINLPDLCGAHGAQ